MNFNILEKLRTKEELLKYFNENGLKITEEEIDTLKQSYNQAEENNTALTMQQLDDVAGGIIFEFIKHLSGCSDWIISDDKLSEINVHCVSESCGKTTVHTYTNPYEFFKDFLPMNIVEAAYKDFIANPHEFSDAFGEAITHLKAEIDKPDFHGRLLAYTLNHPFYQGVEWLCRDYLSMPEIQPHLESLQYSYNHSSLNIQRLMNIAASCVKGINYSYIEHVASAGAVSFSDSSVTLYNTKNFTHVLSHEMFHCLDYRFNCSEHLEDKIDSYFSPSKPLYYFLAGNAFCSENPISSHLNIIMSQILALHPDRRFETEKQLYCEEDKLNPVTRNREIFARLCEIFEHTNGTWIIPSPIIKKLKPSEAKEAKESIKKCLTSFLEERSGVVTRGPVQKRLREIQVKEIMENGFDVKIYFPELVSCFEAEIKDVITKVDSIVGPASFIPDEAPAVVVHPQKGKGKKKKGKKK